MDLKQKYAHNHSMITNKTMYLNGRLFNTYNKISKNYLNKVLSGKNIDLGSGDKGFTKFLESINIESFPYDYPEFDIEKDSLPHPDDSIDFITLNAVIEHITNPEHIFKEIRRVLRNEGLVFIRTPNWQIDFRNFYNDPTHVKPYSPQTIKNFLILSDFNVLFLEPGLIEKSWFWWRLPELIKWEIASVLRGGTKSILAVGYKIKLKENV